MSDPEPATESPEATPAPESESGWLIYHERPVMLQLRQPYIGVTYNARAADGVYRASMNAEGHVRASPILSGVLFVRQSGTPSGVLLILRVPIPETHDFTLIALHPDDVLYCTHIHQADSRIVTP
jgi:hypothetical protein